jgi:hypothetical protein
MLELPVQIYDKPQFSNVFGFGTKTIAGFSTKAARNAVLTTVQQWLDRIADHAEGELLIGLRRVLVPRQHLYSAHPVYDAGLKWVGGF